jgi:hypothetical protein
VPELAALRERPLFDGNGQPVGEHVVRLSLFA